MNIVRLGDPHLGKQFTTGVPLHRRGERERSQWAEFACSLTRQTDLHVTMGDLFDKMFVPYEVVLKAANAYRNAASLCPNTEFVIIRGNHDASRDDSITTAYDVFAAIMEGTKNVHVLQDDPLCIEGHCFIPWHPHRPASDLVPRGSYKSVQGHWDVADFGNNNPNLIPLAKLRDAAPIVYTGHDHTPRVMHDGFVHVVGSMQPYAHGEGDLYVTKTLAELDGTEKNKCLRLVLQPGEAVPADLDCLQLTVTHVKPEETSIDVNLENFDLKKIFEETLQEAGVGADLRQTLWGKMNVRD